MEKSIVGDLINFRGLVYAPVNENGVVFLFGKVADDLNMYIEEIKPGFPDCIGRRFIGKGWERIAIEFEYKSSNFVSHGHDVTRCDVIVCWEHNWEECPIEVVELKSEIQELENYLIKKPGATDKEEKDIESSLEDVFASVGVLPKIREWYEKIFDQVSLVDDTIWAKIGKKYIGWYSPKRAFVSVRIKKSTIRFKCFSGEALIPGAEVANPKFSPRWVKFIVKAEVDVDKAVNIIIESQKRIREAINNGEATSIYSGGEPFGSAKDIEEDEE